MTAVLAKRARKNFGHSAGLPGKEKSLSKGPTLRMIEGNVGQK